MNEKITLEFREGITRDLAYHLLGALNDYHDKNKTTLNEIITALIALCGSVIEARCPANEAGHLLRVLAVEDFCSTLKNILEK